MKRATKIIFALTILVLTCGSPVFAQFYGASQMVQARKAKLIVAGEVVYRGKLLKTLYTHPGSNWQTIVFKIDKVLKGEEKGTFLRVAFFTEKELGLFSKNERLLLVLDDRFDGGCGENAYRPSIVLEKGEKLDMTKIFSKENRDNGNSKAFRKYESSTCFYAYPETAFEATVEEIETMELFLHALKEKN